MDKCSECGTPLPCLATNDLCRECDEQFIFCFTSCTIPCRGKCEQKQIFDRVKPGWDADLEVRRDG